MKKFKLDKIISTRLSALAMAGVIFVTSVVATGCSKEENVDTTSEVTVTVDNSDFVGPIKPMEPIQDNDQYDETVNEIKSLFPTLTEEIVKNTALIVLLDEIAKEDENKKINVDKISEYKAKIDVNKMMDNFNSFLNTLEQTMINNGQLISVSYLTIDSDKEILSKIEEITSNIINGNEDVVKTNFDLIYTLFVNKKEITYGGLKFKIEKLSYSGRTIASVYARIAAKYASAYISNKQYDDIDARTNNQDSKALLIIKLEKLANNMEEKSETDVVALFNEEYNVTSNTIKDKVNVDEETIKNLVNYVNLTYLDSDKVANKDKNAILGEYTDEKVSDVIFAVSAITTYNDNYPQYPILLSKMLVDEYKKTETGKIDETALDYIVFNSIKLLNKTNKDTSAKELYKNPYFINLYKYLTKQDFVHIYGDQSEQIVNYQSMSKGAKFIADIVVYYTLNQRPNIFEYDGYTKQINDNLGESIQYVKKTITGECEKVDTVEFIKTK